MHRISSSGSVNGRFVDGDPSIGQIATALVAAFMNDLQENICYVIEQQGIVLNPGDETQLADAITALVAGSVGTGSGEVPTTRQVLTAGLATGGGTLAVDRTITVSKATPAEVAAGTRDDVAITPFGLLGGLGGRLLAGDGYATLPGGIIVQWGASTIPGNSYATRTLPISFPNACTFAAVEGGNPYNEAHDNDPFVSGKSASSITFYNAVDNPIFINYFAIGY